VYNWGPVLEKIFTGIRAGKLGGSTYTISLGNNGEKIVFNPDYPLPASVKAQAEKLVNKIADGTLTVAQ
jgi:basic membrane lipoprotein Med (substrate-binding protein (PBP1-ABC) superfamily)